VPVRIELGPRDVSRGEMVLVRRDNGGKITSKLDETADCVSKLLEDIHEAMFARPCNVFVVLRRVRNCLTVIIIIAFLKQFYYCLRCNIVSQSGSQDNVGFSLFDFTVI